MRQAKLGEVRRNIFSQVKYYANDGQISPAVANKTSDINVLTGLICRNDLLTVELSEWNIELRLTLLISPPCEHKCPSRLWRFFSPPTPPTQEASLVFKILQHTLQTFALSCWPIVKKRQWNEMKSSTDLTVALAFFFWMLHMFIGQGTGKKGGNSKSEVTGREKSSVLQYRTCKICPNSTGISCKITAYIALMYFSKSTS